LPNQRELSEYNRKRGYIGGGISSHGHVFNYSNSVSQVSLFYMTY
jgi:DNA replication licensing factor MCM4